MKLASDKMVVSLNDKYWVEIIFIVPCNEFANLIRKLLTLLSMKKTVVLTVDQFYSLYIATSVWNSQQYYNSFVTTPYSFV